MRFFNNEKNNRNNLLKRLKWVILITFSMLFLTSAAYFFYYLFVPVNSKKIVEINDSWIYYSEEDPTFQFDSKHIHHIPAIGKNEPFVMETILHKKLEDAHLLIKGHHQWLTVTLNDQVLYSSGHEATKKDPGLSLLILDFPSNYIGKKLKITVSSPFQHYSGLPPKVYLGKTKSMISFIFSQSIPHLVTMIIAFLIAISLLGWTVFLMYKQKRLDHSVLILSLFALSLGFEAISEDILSSILFEPIVHSVLAHVFAIFTSLLLIFYYQSRMTNYNKWYGYFCLIQAFIFGSILLHALITEAELSELMPIANTVSVVSTLITSIASIGEAYKNNHFFVICTPWIVLIATFHCILYLQSALGIYHSSINWSTILFGILLLVILAYHFIEYLIKVGEHRKERLFLQTKTQLIEAHYNKLRKQLQHVDTAKNEFVLRMEEFRSLTEPNQYEDLQTYMTKIIEETKQLKTSLLLSGHQLTNLILAHYEEVAAKKNIKVEFQTDISEEFNVHDDDFTHLLIHILEHSFRETQAIENPLQREIYLSIRQKNQQINIHCEHSTDYDKNIFSTGIIEELIEKEEHDLKTIQSIVDKYTGTLIQEKDQWIDRIKITFFEN